MLVPLTIGPAPAAGVTLADDGDVTCPAALDGVPLSLDEEFAGTPRALANAEGVLVRFTLLCPYRRARGTAVADLTLAWSKYAADDLSCSAVELTSEPAGDGRIQGLVDHPSLSAQVTYGAAGSSVLSAVDEVATELLADVPSDAHPCVGGADSAVDADLALPTTASSAELPVALAVAVVGGSAVVGLVVLALMRRRKRSGAVASSPQDSEVGALAAALRARRQAEATAPPSSSAVGAMARGGAVADEVTAAAAERQNASEILSGATALLAAVEARLDEARSEVGTHRAHARAVRQLAASVRDGDSAEFLSSYAGVTTLAVAATNLVSTSARRAASLVATSEAEAAPTAARAAELEVLHRRVLAAAEGGLDDTRFWLWQDRRLAVMEALGALERLAPRLVASQERLVGRVKNLSGQHAMATEEAEWARRVIDDADRRLGATVAPSTAAPSTAAPSRVRACDPQKAGLT